ncbi:MAG: hypothetical protein IT371_08695 [Deltaproteobacteria bacterium]|nr:hypothetical protein [Deltaproteobacteria bacterium]
MNRRSTLALAALFALASVGAGCTKDQDRPDASGIAWDALGPSSDLGPRLDGPGRDDGRRDQGTRDAGRRDLATGDGGGVNKAKDCASTFGAVLTNAFGRLDGTVLAIVTPSDRQCAQVNSDHLILQVKMNGAAYRMVVNVRSDWVGVSPDVRLRELGAPLVGPAWSEGWHTGIALDYATTLNVHSTSGFSPYAMNALIQELSSRITLGEKVSVYARSSGGTKADSAHLIHRNKAGDNADGAIVLGAATGSPRFLLLHFENQTF